MEEIGSLLARYRATAEQIRMPGQRPSALPLAVVADILLSALDSAGVAGHHSTVIRQHAEQLSRRLSEIAPMDVIASGKPPAATGVIDFAVAHIEHPLADIGYALWRSGRASEHATCLDPDRVRQYVHGYHGVRPLSPDQAAAIPAYMFGRGLQMIAKRVRARRPDNGMPPVVQWINANHQALTDVIQGAIQR